ncbi:amidase signature domain-containing protein [Chaetomium sp. MPI-SDFR-AT-0129]|nr:amidase signature domain-containing protein [Chaetomium sp. MPI-SDFR-AT-0129]
MASARLGLLFLVAASTVLAQLASTGLTVTLNDVYYFISPYPSATLHVPKASLDKVSDVFGFKPVTVIQDRVSRADISALLTNWTSLDDVYQPAFSEAIFHVNSAAQHHDDAVTVSQILSGLTSTLLPLSHADVPSGPYFIHPSGALHRVYRLYDDFAAAFTEPLLPTPNGQFQPLSAKIPGSSTLSIGVPSRLYFTPSPQKPLAGVRIGVKDIYRLAGVKGSNGNRAWYHLYPPSNTTGTAVQRLLDAGAQIVGLQKTSQFANGELATADWVDYHAPFNPRGDGYQDPSSSSAGAGASVASYEWLDLALGSDTGGSIRGPAGAQGLFGNRPSHGLVELDEVMPLAPELDTPGFLVRDVELWDRANSVLYGEKYSSLSQEEKVEWPGEVYTLGFPEDDTEDPADKMFVQFARQLAKFVGGEVKPLDLEKEWAKTKPSEAGNVTLTQLLNTTYITIIGKQQTTLVRDPFYRDYQGMSPFPPSSENK